MKQIIRLIVITGYLLQANALFAFDRQDSLRGANGPGRNWWQVVHYKLQVHIDTATRSISGSNVMRFALKGAAQDSMQLDLQEPMQLHKVRSGKKELPFRREGNVYWVYPPKSEWAPKSTRELELQFSGKPREAVKPPWDGGFIWTRDSMGNPWISVACQGLGASCWWPCKDDQRDEPDSGMSIQFDRIGKLAIVSNGRYDAATNSWLVKNPINSYDVTFYIGDYSSWTDTLQGAKGQLDLSFYALRYNEAKARAQFAAVKPMLRCFEYWFGPYPFYEDGYKLVEAPFLGMEHQSAVAYGNQYQMGYRGKDRSGTDIGLTFDFIIVHESGHEWFGNNITAADVADNWIHEGFTTYSESLFAAWISDKETGRRYAMGEWRNIKNDRPIIGNYNVNDEGSGDCYDKGSAVVHTIRELLHNDMMFRNMLQALNQTYYHKQVRTRDIEAFINQYCHRNFNAIFNQYLRNTEIPQLEYYVRDKRLHYRFTQVVPQFTLPVQVTAGGQTQTLGVTSYWQDVELADTAISFVPQFLITLSEVQPEP
jgi:aminopeptidase N